MAEPTPQNKQMPAGLASEVGDEVHPFLRAISENIKPIIIIVSVFLLGLGAYLAVDGYLEKARKQSVEDLGRIELIADAAERRMNLEAFLTDAPDTLRVNVLFELAAACLELGDKEAALGYWDQIEVPADSDMAVVMDVGRAGILAQEGKWQESLDLLQSLRQAASESYTFTLVRLIAATAEQAGDIELAMQTYEELRSMGQGDSLYLDYKISELARKLEEQG